MTVCKFGDLLFGVFDAEGAAFALKPFKDFSWSASANWAQHDRPGRTPLLEFAKIEPGKISFTAQLYEDLHVSVAGNRDRILRLLRRGEVNFLVLGGHVYGVYKWALTEAAFGSAIFTPSGDMRGVEAKLSFTEYPERVSEW
jgi:hypothetical protein